MTQRQDDRRQKHNGTAEQKYKNTKFDNIRHHTYDKQMSQMKKNNKNIITECITLAHILYNYTLNIDWGVIFI